MALAGQDTSLDKATTNKLFRPPKVPAPSSPAGSTLGLWGSGLLARFDELADLLQGGSLSVSDMQRDR